MHTQHFLKRMNKKNLKLFLSWQKKVVFPIMCVSTNKRVNFVPFHEGTYCKHFSLFMLHVSFHRNMKKKFEIVDKFLAQKKSFSSHSWNQKLRSSFKSNLTAKICRLSQIAVIMWYSQISIWQVSFSLVFPPTVVIHPSIFSGRL